MSLQHPLEIEQILQQEQDFAGRVVELIILFELVVVSSIPREMGKKIQIKIRHNETHLQK